MMGKKPDSLDIKILQELNEDSRRSVRELGRVLGESPSTIYNRIRKLEERKTIKRFTISIDYDRIGYNTTVFASVRLSGAKEKYHTIAVKVAEIQGVHEVHVIGGEYNLLVKIRARSTEEAGKIVLGKIRELPDVASIKADIVFQRILDDKERLY